MKSKKNTILEKQVGNRTILIKKQLGLLWISMKAKLSQLKLHNLRKWAFAALSSLLIVILSYFWSNKPLPFFDRLDGYYLMQRFILDDFDKEEEESVFFSTEVDKELVPCFDDRIEVGNIAISSREQILRFLKMADSCGNYRYIFVDILFDDVQGDSATEAELFSLISNMDRICVVKRLDNLRSPIPLRDSRLEKKSAYNEYYLNNMMSDFRHYPFFMKNEKSVPLRIYEETDSVRMRKLLGGLLYVQGSNICFGCPVIRLSSSMEKSKFKKPYLLGFSLDNEFSDLEDLRPEIEDKVVWIGDFQNDVHSTYVGLVSGTTLAYSAYLTLHKKRHIIRWWQVFLEFLLYMFIVVALLLSWWPQLVERITSNSLLQWVFSFISYGIVLTVWSLLLFITTGTIWNTFIPSISFAFIRYLKNKNVV